MISDHCRLLRIGSQGSASRQRDNSACLWACIVVQVCLLKSFHWFSCSIAELKSSKLSLSGPEIKLALLVASEHDRKASNMVISFFSPPPVNLDVANHPPDINVDIDCIYMDDDDDFGAESAKITSPGEGITSARAFMR